MKKALIIFIKNAIPGKTKTRLAATVGDEMALSVYNSMVHHTVKVADAMAIDKFIFFSEYLAEITTTNNNFFLQIQTGNNLGTKMKNAFASVFERGYDSSVIIGTDCPGIAKETIQTAFDKLIAADVVMGPALDGGYYLLGTNLLHNFLFENISWSTDTVANETINRCKENNLGYELLAPLADVDEEKDLVHFYKHINTSAE